MKNMFFIFIFLFVYSSSMLARVSVAVLFPASKQNSVWPRHESAMRTEAKRINVSLVSYYAEGSHKRQYEQMEQAIARQVDSIILVPVDYQMAGAIVDRAYHLNKRVITYSQIPAMTKNIAMHVAFDYTRIGSLKSQYLLSKVASGNYAVLMGSPTDYTSVISYEGSIAALSSKIKIGDITLLTNRFVISGTYEEAISVSSAMLRFGSSTINAAILPSSVIANAFVDAVEQSANVSQKIYIASEGIDIKVAQNILLDKIDTSILLDDRLLAQKALEIAMYIGAGDSISARDRGNQILTTGGVSIPTYYIDPVPVTKENLDKALIDTALFKRSEIYTANIKRYLASKK